jgi:hypothetical protein
VADHPGPLFSAYVSVNAAIPENQERAYLVRIRDAMKDLGVPGELQRWVRDYVEAGTHPGARTLVLFAAENGLFEVYRPHVDVPETFRWGDPNMAPLTLVIDEYEPYGAVVLDAERFRYFVVSPLGRPDEEIKGSGFREVDLRPSQPYPRSHGSTDADPAGRTQQAKAHRFYKEMGELTRNITFREGARRLILTGPREVTSAFRDALPNELKDRVVAEAPVELGAPEGELLDQLEAIREHAEYDREKELLAQIRESGVRGPDETITALQEENRVYHLAALWELEGEIRWCDNDHLAVRDIAAKQCSFCGQRTRTRRLIDVLVDLSAARGARLDFLRGENENTDTLRREFGGVAGLTRF